MTRFIPGSFNSFNSIKLRIIDDFCSLTTHLALVLHFEMMAASLLICQNDAAFGSRGINRGAKGFVFLYPRNDPMVDNTIELFTEGSLREKHHDLRRIGFLTVKAIALLAQKQVGRFSGISEAICKSFTKMGPLPWRGCVSGRAHVSHCHSEFSAGPFFPRTAHSSFPPNPKGLRGREMTKVHATDGKRSPDLLLIALC